MPIVLRIGPYRFYFFPDESNQPPHIHSKTGDGECKFWLNPVKLADNKNLSPKTIRTIEKIVFENNLFLYAKLQEYHARR
jgi:Domain of unknown function (DUF4160)